MRSTPAQPRSPSRPGPRAGDASSLCILHLDVDGASAFARVNSWPSTIAPFQPAMRHNDERNDCRRASNFRIAVIRRLRHRIQSETVRKQRDRAQSWAPLTITRNTKSENSPQQAATKCSIA